MQRKSYLAKKLEAAALRYQVEVSVFLAGPYIEPKNPMPVANGSNNAHRARYFLFHKMLSEREITSSLGEHQDLLSAGGEMFGKSANAHISELLFAKRVCDCIIILPSSPGSFCEIGLFADHPPICQKMLIIVDEKYKGDKSYFALGPLKHAMSNHSRVEYCSYEDHDGLWRIASEFLDWIVSQKIMQELRVQ